MKRLTFSIARSERNSTFEASLCFEATLFALLLKANEKMAVNRRFIARATTNADQ